jgi:hypothetical protein
MNFMRPTPTAAEMVMLINGTPHKPENSDFVAFFEQHEDLWAELVRARSAVLVNTREEELQLDCHHQRLQIGEYRAELENMKALQTEDRAERDELRRDLKEIADAATQSGWDGVNNSKILSQYIRDLAQERDELQREVEEKVTLNEQIHKACLGLRKRLQDAEDAAAQKLPQVQSLQEQVAFAFDKQFAADVEPSTRNCSSCADIACAYNGLSGWGQHCTQHKEPEPALVATADKPLVYSASPQVDPPTEAQRAWAEPPEQLAKRLQEAIDAKFPPSSCSTGCTHASCGEAPVPEGTSMDIAVAAKLGELGRVLLQEMNAQALTTDEFVTDTAIRILRGQLKRIRIIDGLREAIAELEHTTFTPVGDLTEAQKSRAHIVEALQLLRTALDAQVLGDTE